MPLLTLAVLSIILPLVSFASGSPLLAEKSFDFQTEREQIQQSLNSWFEQGKLAHPVAILNKESVFFESMQENLWSRSDKVEQRNAKLFQAVKAENSKIELNEGQLVSLEAYVFGLPEHAFSFGFLKAFNKPELSSCVVVPRLPNTSVWLENGRILGFGNNDLYGDNKIQNFSEMIELEAIQRLSFYREVARCIDRKFFPEAVYNNSQVSDGQSVHRAEAFADVFALLYLYTQGHEKLARKRAIQRGLYSRVFGRAAGLGQLPGQTGRANIGAIYHLGEVLLAAEKYILYNQESLAGKSFLELIPIAEEIVEKNAMTTPEFTALEMYVMADNPETVINQYEEWTWSFSELFYSALLGIYEYLELTDLFLGKAFSAKNELNKKDLMEIDLAELCRQKDDAAEFSSALQKLRENLKNSEAPYLKQLEQSLKLHLIYPTLQRFCSESD